MENYCAGELASSFKVHDRMCSELLNLVVIVSKIIPEIEAARPRTSGMEALCLLTNDISKAKSLLGRCSDSSMLYLALTGDRILSRCDDIRNLLECSLSKIKNTVPVMLADKISGIILALRSATFCLDPAEEEAGKLLHEILHQYCARIFPTEEFALSAITAVCSQLNISSRKALAIEQRTIKRQLDQCERSKKKILCLFFGLLKKYRKVTIEEQMDRGLAAAQEFASPPDLSWENLSYSNGSLGSCIKDLSLPLDFNNMSLGSRQDSDPSVSHEICALPLDSSCNATVENVRRLLKISDESWSMMPFRKLIQLLFRFLRYAHDVRDMEAQTTGCLYLLQLVQNHRNSTCSYMKEDAYSLLATFLDTKLAEQALSILEVLSFDQQCGYQIAASGALVGILNILESQVDELVEPALNILSNLSAGCDIGTFIDSIPRCVVSIAKLLESGSEVEQERAVSILHSLCSQQVEYCQLVMDVGLPGLVHASINGTKKANAMAMELLLILQGKSNTTGESCVSA